MRGDKKSDTAISKFIRELGRIGILGEDQNTWLVRGRDWIQSIQKGPHWIDWIELRLIDNEKRIYAQAGLVPKPDRLVGREIIGQILESKA